MTCRNKKTPGVQAGGGVKTSLRDELTQTLKRPFHGESSGPALSTGQGDYRNNWNGESGTDSIATAIWGGLSLILLFFLWAILAVQGGLL